MRKTAQQKFNEYLDECRETTQAVNQVISGSHEFYGDYAFAAGYLSTVLQTVISELPKARRAAVREQFLRKAAEFQIRKELA